MPMYLMLDKAIGMKLYPVSITLDVVHNHLRMRTVRNAAAVSRRTQAILRELSWLQRNGDLMEIGHRSPAYGVFGRKYQPKYPASPFIPKRKNLGKYNKSKTKFWKPKLRIRAKPVYKAYGKFIKTLSDGRRLHQYGVKPR